MKKKTDTLIKKFCFFGSKTFEILTKNCDYKGSFVLYFTGLGDSCPPPLATTLILKKFIRLFFIPAAFYQCHEQQQSHPFWSFLGASSAAHAQSNLPLPPLSPPKSTVFNPASNAQQQDHKKAIPNKLSSPSNYAHLLSTAGNPDGQSGCYFI